MARMIVHDELSSYADTAEVMLARYSLTRCGPGYVKATEGNLVCSTFPAARCTGSRQSRGGGGIFGGGRGRGWRSNVWGLGMPELRQEFCWRQKNKSEISWLGLSRLCSATFEQLLAFGATFCGFSNLEQVLPFRAIFEQNIVLSFYIHFISSIICKYAIQPSGCNVLVIKLSIYLSIYLSISEWLGIFKCLATGLDAFLLSFSTSRRCSRNRSNSRLSVSPMYNFLQRVQVIQ